MHRKNYSKQICLYVLFCLSCAFNVLYGQTHTSFKEIIISVEAPEGTPLSYATVHIEEYNRAFVTDDEGIVKIRLDNIEFPFSVNISYVGMSPIYDKINSSNQFRKGNRLKYRMKYNNLYLKEVEVNAIRQKRESNTSLLINRNSIDNIQAYSVADVMQLLPGKAILNTDVHNAKFLTLRSVLSGNISNPLDAYERTHINDFTRNAAFGISFYVDGTPISNNTNMQLDSYGKWGSIKTFDRRFNTDNNENVGNGLDLRMIPASSIENIEIISGVAPVKYGDLSNGAVIINRQAGVTPFYGSIKIQHNIVNTSLGKGINLNKDLGILHFNLDYVQSTKDKRDNMKSFSNLNFTTMWTHTLSKKFNWRNTFSLDFGLGLDGLKNDPDQPINRTHYRSSNLKLVTRGSLSTNVKLFDAINYNTSISFSKQHNTHEQFIVVRDRVVITDAYEDGVYESDITPPKYVSKMEIDGKPLALYFNFEAKKTLRNNNWLHDLSMGTTINYEANLGKGKIFDASHPFYMSNLNGRGDRSYKLQKKIKLFQAGGYLQDRLNKKVGSHLLTTTAGIRFDLQNGYFGISPRINSSFILNNGFSINAAYGLSRKAPATAYLYPENVYFDYTVFSHYNDDYKKRLYLYQTKVIKTKNPRLKSPYSHTIELGAQFRKGKNSLSLTGYLKIDKNGITSRNVIDTMRVHLYEVTGSLPSGKPTYAPNGENFLFISSYHTPENSLYSKNMGVELLGNIIKIPRLDISANFSLVYNYSYYFVKGEQSKGNVDIEREAVVGIYRATRNNSQEIVSTISLTKHIPKIGFIINARIQNFWFRKYHRYDFSIYPVAYYDQHFNIVRLTPEEARDPQIGYLRLQDTGTLDIKQPFFIPNCHIRISKEIGKNVRLSCYINNFFNYRPYMIKNDTKHYFNESPSLGMNLTYKF